MKRIVIIVAIVAILVALAYSGRTMDSEEVIDSKPDSANNGGSLTLTSPAFKHMERIPSRYTCDGENLSPPLNISGVPEGVESLVLLMDDPDIPDYVKKERGIEVFDHWVLYGIDPETVEIGEGQAIGSQGLNSLEMLDIGAHVHQTASTGIFLSSTH